MKMMEDLQRVEARVTHHFRAPAERVFDAWLDPDQVRAWMSLPNEWGSFDVRRVEIDPRVGGRFTFSDMREDGESVTWGEYRMIARPHRLVFTWWTSREEEEEDTSVVTITIAGDDSGCTLTLVHQMDAKWTDHVDSVTASWGSMLRQIDTLLGD
ncbi:MAG TPA: SRPBCC domain-containing protein [Devosiaceae bacterium]|jgi:uncharacterized protein YndB with AHSA1/START domain|nr:SRPBCC domain-containing protein [Devosiaceae bacterium]